MKYTALFSAILLFSPLVHAIADMKPTLTIQLQILPDSTYLFIAKEIWRTKNTSLIEVKDQSLGNPKLYMPQLLMLFYVNNSNRKHADFMWINWRTSTKNLTLTLLLDGLLKQFGPSRPTRAKVSQPSNDAFLGLNCVHIRLINPS